VEKKSKPARPHTQPEINEYRRQLLVEGTIKSMAERGVGGTTVRSICADAGSSRGLIGHYYASKEELVAEAFRQLFTSVSRSLEGQVRVGGSAGDRLRAIPRLVFSPPVFTEFNRHAFLAFWHEIRFNPAVREANRELYLDYTRRTQALFGQAAVECKVEIDHRSAAIGLIALIDGLWLELTIDDKAVSVAKAIDLCLHYIDHQLGLRNLAGSKPPGRKRVKPA
jgi:TetR/AcrR family transcriptional regulator, transcriptional repressor of bet genes